MDKSYSAASPTGVSASGAGTSRASGVGSPLVAKFPANPRDEARLLLAKGDKITDHKVLELANLIEAGALVIANDCQVMPARLKCVRTSDKRAFELMLLENINPDGDHEWESLAFPKKHLKLHDTLEFQSGASASVVNIKKASVSLKSSTTFKQIMQDNGSVPLPPYIKRLAVEQDKTSYQTMFAKVEGAVAAPTAGLHFTPRLLGRLKEKGCEVLTLTMLVSGGTFLPLREDNFTSQSLHSERYQIPASVWQKILASRSSKSKRQLVAIGTTSARAIESAFREANFSADDKWHTTNIFLNENNPPRYIDALLTNFHQAGSSLIELVESFCGKEQIEKIYRHAIENNYRFYSYGDACLLFPKASASKSSPAKRDAK